MEDYLGHNLVGEMESSKIIDEVNLFRFFIFFIFFIINLFKVDDKKNLQVVNLLQ